MVGVGIRYRERERKGLSWVWRDTVIKREWWDERESVCVCEGNGVKRFICFVKGIKLVMGINIRVVF